MRLKYGVLFLFCMCAALRGFADDSLNMRYRYPISVGVEYQPLSALAFVNQKTTTNEIAARARVPLPFLPVLQPFAFGGLIISDSDISGQPSVLGGMLAADAVMPDYDDRAIWDHRDMFAALGMGYAHRISKEFELGADAFFGLSQSFYPNRVVTDTGEWYPIGDLGILAGVAGKIALNPSFNLSIDVSPSLRYVRSLGNLHEFDGLYFGVGFSVHYRFGKDPDAPQREIRSIRFGEIAMPSLFAAMQSYYAKNPAGTVIITNTEKKSLEEVQVFFHQAGFMDSPTPAKPVGTIEAGQSLTVPLLASFNQEVFSTEGVTPLTGEVIVTYSVAGQRAEQKQPVSYDLYDKTSMTWDNDAKIAAFITPADSALRNYTSFIRQTCKDGTIPLFNGNLQFAIQAFEALTEMGILYQADPTLPFTAARDNSMVVDSVSLPRDTLKRITGDCDDLTVLYCSLLESVGIESGFITVPGHIYAVFNTKEPASEYMKIHPNREMTISLEGSLWVPVEITMIGRKDFLSAWRTGMEEWSAWENDPKERRLYITREEQTVYRPVGLRETDLGLQYGDKADIVAGFSRNMDSLVEQVADVFVRKAELNQGKKEWNQAGMVYAQFLRYEKANEAFGKALAIDPNFISARVNQANLLYLKGDYGKALSAYEKALSEMERTGKGAGSIRMKVLVNLSRTYYQLARYDKAKEYYDKAQALDPERALEFVYLAAAAPASDTGRAAEERDLRYEVLFAEGEE